MRKLMKKKVSLLGKEVSVFAIVVVAMITLASAALVPYLSGMVTGNVGVSSPMSNIITTDAALDIKGGETATIIIETKNLANVNITGEVENIITNDIGLTCGDFVSIEATTVSGGITDGPYDLIAIPGLCTTINDTAIAIGYGPVGGITWTAGQLDVNTIVATFQPNAFGDYKFSSLIVPLP